MLGSNINFLLSCKSMAATLGTHQSLALLSLKKEVTCPQCQDIFVDARKLPCEHVLCFSCLEKSNKNEDQALTCPTCSKSLQTPDIIHLPTAQHINRLVDIYYKSLEEFLQGSPARTAAEKSELPLCSEHMRQPLALFCETCEKIVCRDCVLTQCSVNKHDYAYLRDVVTKYEAAISKDVKPLQQLLTNMSSVPLKIESEEKTFEAQQREELEKTTTSFDNIIQALENEKSKVTSKIQGYFEKQAIKNATKKRELQECIEEISVILSKAKSMTISEAQEGSSIKLEAQQRILQDALQRHSIVPLRPSQLPGIDVLVQVPPKYIQKKDYSFHVGIGYKYDLDDFKMLQCLSLNQVFQIEIHPITFPETEICSKFISEYDDRVASVNVTENPNENSITLMFVPQQRGRHQLHIERDGAPVFGSPLSAYVYVDPVQIPHLGRQGKIPVTDALGIKCHDEKLYLTGSGSKITVVEPKRQDVIATSEIELPANKIEIYNDHIYSTSTRAHMLVKATTNGKLISYIGGYGTEQGKLHHPNGLQMNDNGELFVCDTLNHRIQVFDGDLNLLRAIGERGVAPGEFQYPNDLTLDKDGNLYVVESKNHRIQVLNTTGEHVRFIGIYGDKKLNHPVSAAIYNDHIYVTDTGKKGVFIYSLTGDFVTSIVDKDIRKPEYIAIDMDGFIYVTHDRKEVLVY